MPANKLAGEAAPGELIELYGMPGENPGLRKVVNLLSFGCKLIRMFGDSIAFVACLT